MSSDANMNCSVVQTFQQHYVLRILLSFLPNEIVNLIAFRFGGIVTRTHLEIKKGLHQCMDDWNNELINKTIYSIMTYRSHNNVSEEAFKFPSAKKPPYINKGYLICNYRIMKNKFQGFQDVTFKIPYNNKFRDLNRDNMMDLVKKMYISDSQTERELKECGYLHYIHLDKLVRFYYRYDYETRIKYDSLTDYARTITEPWY